MTGPVIDRAYVQVLPEMKQFGPQVTKGVAAGMTGATNEVTKFTKTNAKAGKDSATGWKDAFSSVKGQVVGFAAGGAAAVAGFKIVDWFKGSIDAASDLNESLNKSQVVFGKYAPDIEKWASTAATAMGQSTQQAIEAAATFGNFFEAMGIGQPKAASMSKQVVQLASDLASFNNADPADVLEALRSGLAGEVEPLRRFGIDLSDVRLRQEAVNLGLEKNTKNVLPQNIKAQAAFSLILKQTKTAQGDFARTSDGLANKQRIVAAQFEDAKAKVGNAFLPAMLQVKTVLSTGVLPALASVLALLTGAFKIAWTAVGPVVKVASDALSDVAGFAQDNIDTIKILAAVVAALWLAFKVPVWVGGALTKVGDVLDTLKLKAMYAADSVKGTGGKGLLGGLSSAGGVAGTAEGKLGKFTKVLGNIGPYGAIAATGVSLAVAGFSLLSHHSDDSKKRVDALTEAIKTGTTATVVWAQAQKLGLGPIQTMGVSQAELVNAVTGTSSAYDAARQQLDVYAETAKNAALASGRFGASNQQVQSSVDAANAKVNEAKKHLAELRDNYVTARDKAADYVKSQGDAALAADIQNDKLPQLAKNVGLQTDAYAAARLAIDQAAASQKQQTDQMILAGDAAGLLKQKLDGLLGTNLSLAQSQTALQQSVNSTVKTLKDNKDAIKGTTDAALADQAAIQSNVQSARDHALAVAQSTHSQLAAVDAYKQSRDNLLKTLDAQHLLTPAVQDYINKLYDVNNLKIPAKELTAKADKAYAEIKNLQARIDGVKQGKVPGLKADSAQGKAVIAAMQNQINSIKQGKPTELKANQAQARTTIIALQNYINSIKQNKVPGLKANSAAANQTIRDLQNQINGLRGKTLPITLTVSDQRLLAMLNVNTGNLKRAAGSAFYQGGSVGGPGGIDQVPIWATAGEFVVNRQAAARHRSLLEAINGNRYRNGGIVVDVGAAQAIFSLMHGVSRNLPPALSAGGGNLGAWIVQAMALTGVPAMWGPALRRRAMFESGGNPNAVNLWDSNAAAGHPSKGLMQTIDSTFRAYALAGHGNIFNPVDNMAAAIRYIESRYGSIFAIDPPVSGYRNGAWRVKANQLAALHADETVLPPEAARRFRDGGPDPAEIGAAVAEALTGMALKFDGAGAVRYVNEANMKLARRR